MIIPGPGKSVVVNSQGLLGTSAPSSIRYKEAVRDIGADSDVLMRLRPVAFRYRKELVDADGETQFGLIAEEVAEVAPELVINDAEGRPSSVRYELLTPMLLNELQKQQRTIDGQAAAIEALASQLAAVELRLAETATRKEL